MSSSSDRDSENIHAAGLSERLKLLAGIRPSEGLRDRLVATIPPMAGDHTGRGLAGHWSGPMSWLGVGVAAAVVLIAAFWLLPPMGRSLPSIADINDHSPSAMMADANVPHPQDSNIHDNNAL